MTKLLAFLLLLRINAKFEMPHLFGVDEAYFIKTKNKLYGLQM